MPKRFALCLICWIAALQLGPTGAAAQSEPDAQFTSAPQPAMTPDDPHLFLMIRNAVIALNQANLTGNYSVLRDLGTPNFQMSNNSARLAESFATLRARKLDISPVMVFNPNFAAPPSINDGQVLRVTGFFPTTPEQVNFDLAFQLTGEQWMLAAIAVNVTPPGENVQAIAAPTYQFPRTAETGDAKPIRIDLSQPSALPTQPAAPKKAAPKKPKLPAQKTAAAQPATPPASVAAPEQRPALAPIPPLPPAPDGPAWNPFGR